MEIKDLQVKPYRKTLLQTAIILNVSKRTVRRMADKGVLEWSDGQITTESITKYIEKSNGKRKKEETEEEVEKKLSLEERKPASQKPTINKFTGKPKGGWMKG